MKLSDINTEGFFFDPKSKDYTARLLKHKEFDFKIPDVDNDKVYVYLSLLYEPTSPLYKDIQFYPHRKYEAAKTAGFPMKKNTFDGIYEKIVLGEVVEVNIATVKYCMLLRNVDWGMLVAYTSILAKEMAKSLGSTYTYVKDKKGEEKRVETNYDVDTIKNIKFLSNEIKELEKKLFGGEEVREMRDALYSAVEMERVMLRPEDMAEMLMANEDPVDGYNPYGDYKPEPLKYIGSQEPNEL